MPATQCLPFLRCFCFIFQWGIKKTVSHFNISLLLKINWKFIHKVLILSKRNWRSKDIKWMNESFIMISEIMLVTCLTAWSEEDQSEMKEKGTQHFNSALDIFLDYTEYSTVQGLIYIFFPYQVFMLWKSNIFLSIFCWTKEILYSSLLHKFYLFSIEKSIQMRMLSLPPAPKNLACLSKKESFVSNFIFNKLNSFSFFCYKAWPFHSKHIIFLLYKYTKLNSRNWKTKKIKDW